MAEENTDKYYYLRWFSAMFGVFFFSCFIVGLLKAREVGIQFRKDDYWIISYVSDNTKIINDKGKYKLLFEHPENNTSFLNDLSTKKINEFSSIHDLKEKGIGHIDSQTVQLSLGIITSTMIATKKDSIKALYRKKPSKGMIAVAIGLAAVGSGYWLGYQIAKPDLKPDPDTLNNFLRKSENWKQIKRASLISIFLKQYESIKPKQTKSTDTKYEVLYSALMEKDAFKQLKNFSMKISEIGYSIGNDDFEHVVNFAEQIVETEPKDRFIRKREFAKIILNNPQRLVWAIAMDNAVKKNPNFDSAIEKEMKDANITREEVLIKNSW